MNKIIKFLFKLTDIWGFYITWVICLQPSQRDLIPAALLVIINISIDLSLIIYLFSYLFIYLSIYLFIYLLIHYSLNASFVAVNI